MDITVKDKRNQLLGWTPKHGNMGIHIKGKTQEIMIYKSFVGLRVQLDIEWDVLTFEQIAELRQLLDIAQRYMDEDLLTDVNVPVPLLGQ